MTYSKYDRISSRRTAKTVWHTFTMDQYGMEHESYAKAAWRAQCDHDTNERPKRLGRGIYQLKRTYIATTEAMHREGFTEGFHPSGVVR